MSRRRLTSAPREGVEGAAAGGQRCLRDCGRRRRRRGRVRVCDSFQLDGVDDYELTVGLYVSYEAAQVRVRAFDRERDAYAGEDALHDALRALVAPLRLVLVCARHGLLQLREADAAADTQVVLDDEAVHLLDD